MHGYSTGMMSFDTWGEVAFQFRITPWLAFKGIVFSIVIGALGSLFPAIRASRLPVIAALKAV
jgi:putative ABC transport system permease protein